MIPVDRYYFTIKPLIFFFSSLKGHHPLKSIKPVLLAKRYIMWLFRFHRALAANLLCRCANYQDHINTGKPIPAGVSIATVGAPASIKQKFALLICIAPFRCEVIAVRP